MGILCLAAGCYKHCLNPTSRVPFMCDTITARSSTTNGEQELGQSTRTWIMHGTSRGQALPKVEAKGAVGEPGVLNQVRDPQPANRKRTPSRIGGVRRVHRHVGCWIKSLCCHHRQSLPLLPCLPVIFRIGIIPLDHLLSLILSSTWSSWIRLR